MGRMADIKKEIVKKVKDFKAYEVEYPEEKKTKLRLLSKPIYTYSDSKRNIDLGMIFAFAHGKNPEVLITFESVDGELSCELVRVGGAEMHVTWNGRKIWTSDHDDGRPLEQNGHRPSYVSFRYEDCGKIADKLEGNSEGE